MRTLLVANRGEIARRIFRTARAMGLRTVALHGDGAARDEPYVGDADVAVAALDGRDTFLRPDIVAGLARTTDADAVHPGYGFLSERAEAARTFIDAGLTWVGPHPHAIATMGDKLAAKAAAAEAGVPLLPGCELGGDDPTAWAAAIDANDVGYPLLVKAAAGGGGRGMRLVTGPAELSEAVVAARREAEASFGDGTVFAERYVARARHVEIQVVGDRHGHVVHLGERECSIQRRHQKVIEEAPSPMVDEALRHEMGAAAVALGRAIGYDSVGTIEYVVDADSGEWWFLEMNTRLQVEHPVTEAVTGLDLVRLQLEIAEGAVLPFSQDDVRLDGHAIEVRLVAEDPGRGWIPSTGTIHRWRPDPHDGVRWDSGVEDGSVVSAEFDSLLAKGVAHSPTRAEASRRLARSLRHLRCQGVATDRDLLVRCLEHDAFLAGELHTGFLDEHPALADGRWERLSARRRAEGLPPEGVVPAWIDGEDEVLAEWHAVVAAMWLAATLGGASPWPRSAPGWRVGPVVPDLRLRGTDHAVTGWQDDTHAAVRSTFEVDGREIDVHLAQLRPVLEGRRDDETGRSDRGGPGGGRAATGGDLHVTPGAAAHHDPACGEYGVWMEHDEGGRGGNGYLLRSIDGERIVLGLHGVELAAEVTRVDDRLWVSSVFGETELRLVPRFPDPTAAAAVGGPTAPLPGKVLSVEVGPGDAVVAGQVLVVLEAMKVEHRITAPTAGVVDEVLVGPGDTVEAHQVLVRLADPAVDEQDASTGPVTDPGPTP